MEVYLGLLKRVLETGEYRDDRTGVGAYSLFGEQLRFDLRKGFPLLTTKRVYLKGIVHELLWFLKGSTNIGYLRDNAVHIWDAWADENGDLGPVYGAQWVSWKNENGEEINQIEKLIEGLKRDPYSRRHVVSAWNVGQLDRMALPPCHMFFQFFVSADGGLSCQLYQRSADIFLGVPFNIASYSILTSMIAQVCGYYPKEFVHTFGDVHIYTNHQDAVRNQLERDPRKLPILALNPSIKTLWDFRFEDIQVHDYDPHPAIKAPIAV